MRYRKTCNNCGKEFTSASLLEIAEIEICDVCHTFLGEAFEEYDPDARLAPAAGESPGFEKEGLPDELELRYVGTSITVHLPRMAGVVGRVPVNCDEIKTFSTISRTQFSYKYLPDGGLEITNKSQYGTKVNGVFLEVGESSIAVPSSMIEMGGCYSFELLKKEEI